MKKFILMMFMAVSAMVVNAQTTVQGSKLLDNVYVGVQGGLATKTTQNRWLSNTNPNAGVRIGKDITPVFGLVVEGIVYFNDRAQTVLGEPNVTDDVLTTARSRDVRTNTFAKALNVNALAKINVTNLIFGYKGEPRTFEVSALYGFGWGKGFGKYNRWNLDGEVGSGFYGSELAEAKQGIYDYNDGANELNSKAALNFALNLGSAKAFQIFVEPSITYCGLKDFKYNINRSTVQLNAGVVYKFKNSNGTHNFKLAKLYDQDEVDRLNALVNDLRNREPEVKEVVKEVVKVEYVDKLSFVTFAQGKYELTEESKKTLDALTEGTHVKIVGMASPEGTTNFNQNLSDNRAKVVADYLKSRGVVVDEAVGKGVQGSTSNRIAIITVQ